MQCATMHTMHAQRLQAGLPGDIESCASTVSLVVNTAMCDVRLLCHYLTIVIMRILPRPIYLCPSFISQRTTAHLKFGVFVADVLHPVLHGVDVLPLPLPAVLGRQLVPDLPSDLLQVPLLLSEEVQVLVLVVLCKKVAHQPGEGVVAGELHALLHRHLLLLVV